MKWAAALLGSVLLLARLVAAQPEILHPPGSAAPVEGLPILLEFGGTGSNDDAFTSGECVEVFTDPVCVGGTNAGGACVGASACPGGTCGLKKLRSAGDACGTGSGTPGPTVTPFACATGYAVQVVGATPGCVLLPTPDGAGAGAAATQTPWSCGAGNGARGMGGTPECFVVPTPDGSVATVTPGGGTPQPIATSTSAPGTADGFARADHVHHIADGAIGPAKLSAAVPTPQPVPTAVAFVNQANSFTGTNEFLNNVDLNSPARLALDPTGCVGAACSKVILRDNEGNAAIIYTASTPGLWSATGTGINRANDLACTGCVDVSDLGFATPTPVPTTHNDLSGLQGGAAGEYYHLSSAQYSAKILATPTATVTATPVACATDALGRGGLIAAHPEQCGVPVATATPTVTATATVTVTATPTPTATTTPIVCTAGQVLDRAHPEACVAVVTAILVQEGDSTVDAAATTLDFNATAFDVTSSPSGEANVTLSSAVSQLGSTIEGTELASTFTIPAGTTVDFGSTTNKAPLDLPRDTGANCSSVTSEGRVCWETDTDLLGIGTGSVHLNFLPMPNYGPTPTPVATQTTGGPTATPAPTNTALATPQATSTAATATPTPAPTATAKAGIDGRPVFGVCWSEGAIGTSTNIYFTGGGSSSASQATWTPARDFDVWVGKLCIKPQFDALQGQINVVLHTNNRAGCRATAEAGNANCGTAPVRQDVSSVTIVAGSSWYDSDSQCSTGWVRVPAGVLYRYTETNSGWHTPPGGGAATVSATWMVCAATPF